MEKEKNKLEKENKRLKIFIIIFMAITICLGTFYLNVVCFGAGCESKSPKPLIIVNPSKSTSDVEKNDDENSNSDDVSVSDLKAIFEKVYLVRTSPNPYCGSNSKTSTKTSPNGGLYSISTEYHSYDEMISELTKYATEDVLARNKEDYLDENGQLYCASHGKDGMCGPKDYMIQITKREDKKINATAVVKKACGNFEEEYTYDEEFTIEYIKNDNNWIISEYTQTKGELDYYKNN